MVLIDKLTAIANSIRAITGGTALLSLDEMAYELRSIGAGNNGDVIGDTLYDKLTAIADAIRVITDDTKQFSLDEMAQIIANIDVRRYYTIRFLDGDTVLQESLIEEGEMPVYTGETPEKDEHQFLGWKPEIVAVTSDCDYIADWKSMTSYTRNYIQRSFKTLNTSLITTMPEQSAFAYNNQLTTVNLPAVTTLGHNAFRDCSALLTATFASAESAGSAVFYGCSSLRVIDFYSLKSINGSYFIEGSKQLKALILRGDTVVTLSSSLGSNSNLSRSYFIYVPRALVDSYKSATNWSAYSSRFRALEDYTVDGTTTGALRDDLM